MTLVSAALNGNIETSDRRSSATSHLRRMARGSIRKMMALLRPALPILLVCAFTPGIVAVAAAQAADPMTLARDAVTAGRRPDALATLATHLAATPRDVDARLLYGLVLSWEGRYEEARRELQQVLTQAPSYTDARVALMNVAWWSGDTNAARDAADLILSQDPGNQKARQVREQINAASRPWWVGLSYGTESFSDDREVWHESAASITRLTPRGSVILRASDARRFGSQDRLVEVEFYPKFRAGTYAFIGVGGSVDATLYPTRRVAFDLYQGIGHGFEVSGGLRQLRFDTTTNIYVGTLTKYVGNWMLTGKVFHVPGEGPLDSTSYHGTFRRYVRQDGVSYVGLTYSHGFSREEIRHLSDLTTLNADTITVQMDQQFAKRVRIFGSGGTSRQERQFRSPLWQTSIGGGLMVQF